MLSKLIILVLLITSGSAAPRKGINDCPCNAQQPQPCLRLMRKFGSCLSGGVSRGLDGLLAVRTMLSGSTASADPSLLGQSSRLCNGEQGSQELAKLGGATVARC
ncbi:unnamed protein product [Lampetra planeri]